MAPKVFLIQALAALAAATPVANPEPNFGGYPSSGCKNPAQICQQIQSYLGGFPTQSAMVTSFCTKVLNIKPTTVPTIVTTTCKTTSTINAIQTITSTSTPTAYTSSQTCFQNTATANPAQKRSPHWGGSSWGSGTNYNEKLSSACSCFGVNLSPTTTSTSTKTVTSAGASTTVYSSTKTSTVTASTVSTVLTNYVPSTGSYTAEDGSTYTEYDGYDFYGYDIDQGSCGPDAYGNPGKIDTRWHGSYTCNGFEDCQDACSAYNDQRQKDGQKDPQDLPCAGVTFHLSGFCYLKSAIPGNGAPNCSPRSNADDDSAILVKQASS